MAYQCQVRKSGCVCGYLARRRYDQQGQFVGWFCSNHWKERAQFFASAWEVESK